MGKDQESRIVKPKPEERALIEKLNPRLAEIGLQLTGPRTMRRLRPASVNAQRQMSIEEIEPREGDFLIVTTRATSRDLIDNGWIVMDFTREGVLEGSVDFYKPKGKRTVPVFTEHWWAVGSTVGWVEEAYFSERDEGIDNAGVNTILRVDAKLNPDLARGLLGGVITAVSVTDEWDFDLSHDDLDYEFWEMMGREVDGEIVRLIVTEYRRVYEQSFVGIGADYNGRVLGVRWAGGGPENREFYEGEPEGGAPARSGRRGMVAVPDAARETTGGIREGGGAREQEDEMNDVITLDRLGAILGKDFSGEKEPLEAAEQAVRSLKREVEVMRESRNELQKKIEELEPMAEAGRDQIETLRADVQKAVDLIYQADEERCPDELREEITNADYKELQRMARLYEVKLKSALSFPDGVKRSSIPSPLEDEEAKTEKPLPDLEGIVG